MFKQNNNRIFLPILFKYIINFAFLYNQIKLINQRNRKILRSFFRGSPQMFLAYLEYCNIGLWLWDIPLKDAYFEHQHEFLAFTIPSFVSNTTMEKLTRSLPLDSGQRVPREVTTCIRLLQIHRSSQEGGLKCALYKYSRSHCVDLLQVGS